MKPKKKEGTPTDPIDTKTSGKDSSNSKTQENEQEGQNEEEEITINTAIQAIKKRLEPVNEKINIINRAMDENPPEEDPRVGKRLDEANMRRILEENCHIVESGANKTSNEEIRDRINESEEMILKGIKIIRETDERILENLEYLDDYEAPPLWKK